MKFKHATVFLSLLLTAGLTTLPSYSQNQAPATVSLIHLTEEEKLAHDLYLSFGQKWNHRVFFNIQAAESRHLQRMRSVLQARQLKDPSLKLEFGKFSTAQLQAVYQAFKKAGEVSLPAALAVGLEIEERDLADLKVWQAQTQDAFETLVAGQLIQASSHHLQAFYRALQAQGVSYTPKHLSQQEFDQALAQAHRRGPGRASF
ncbi:hypothetical protein COW36_20945 [bacterium (Candidatus Blackallbacteria) CG17_big_fil_post_rev_8_21_14_2_50_48_46]|uniref:DUF2202 domain-containing protein n=1 Tax=bacterium (Candidatus Blackallbacteria) CG17_big_fil_post_rev_8_21_14_2_50_48_46 TaxID=2014261 RepID=A0A2M7FYQ7_9BACT|nr:MAG: hypothetical protein COW64_14255 [bacterium (Candidatus Blackallbacteria) CG18_big_fil_WC_8_21_14_2_50_49_26]PIW14510.1 MAG: hypothetical protein COW36_20945 [bacterium (Candidatus Blackallbacteria) CG17_big_fil_post_rev_8_21_14_2_50_48_46]PIW47195.1 MAG: hypothetical protein COW20_13390 [bacterium (Candidatus Blackallbacteria) CG13_big_fil_rev_8_21_14_2_50_49_14]